MASKFSGADDAKRFVIGHVYNTFEYDIAPEHIHLFPVGRSTPALVAAGNVVQPDGLAHRGMRLRQDKPTRNARKSAFKPSKTSGATAEGSGDVPDPADPVVERRRNPESLPLPIKRPRSRAQLRTVQELPHEDVGSTPTSYVEELAAAQAQLQDYQQFFGTVQPEEEEKRFCDRCYSAYYVSDGSGLCDECQAREAQEYREREQP